METPLEITLLMPCLNEAETIENCVRKALSSLDKLKIRGEVLIADNGSTDGSIELAEKLGARVVRVPEKGYGNALRGGIEAALGKWILMGDADDSYDFSEISGFLEKLREGYELVMGCRLPSGGGTIKPGAMPWKNRWLGNPALTTLGRTLFKTPAHDFHCGMRGFTKEAYRKMDLQTTGMEFASEMVIMASLKKLRVAETPITLYPDGRSRPPHLKPWRDGWRHLRFMLIYSPRWLFLVPGLFLTLVGGALTILLSRMTLHVGAVVLDVGTMAMSAMMIPVGIQLIAFAFFTKVFAIGEGLLPPDKKFSGLFKFFTLEKGIIVGVLFLGLGFGIALDAFSHWRAMTYGPLDTKRNLQHLIPSATCFVIGAQIIASSFFLSVLGLKTARRTPPGPPEPPR